MAKFKLEDRVQVIRETQNRYVGEVDTIVEHVSGNWGSLECYYLKNCYLTFKNGDRLFFDQRELELVEEFYWRKKIR